MKSITELPPVEVGGSRLVGRVVFALLVLASALIGAFGGLLLVYSTDLPNVSSEVAGEGAGGMNARTSKTGSCGAPPFLKGRITWAARQSPRSAASSEPPTARRNPGPTGLPTNTSDGKGAPLTLSMTP